MQTQAQRKPPFTIDRVLTRVIVVLLIALVAVAAYFGGRETAPKKTSVRTATGEKAPSSFDYAILNQITDILHNQYVKPSNLNDQTLYQAAINGLLNPLNDSGTYYLDPDALKNSQAAPGTLGDVGIRLAVSNGELVAGALTRGGPAEGAGLKAGDIIKSVDGQTAEGWSAQNGAWRLKGTPGSQVKLTMQRPNSNNTQDIIVTREQPRPETVSSSPPPGGIRDSQGNTPRAVGYLKISDFSAATADQL